MSKIGVELARSVDEQEKALRPQDNGANYSRMGMSHGIRDYRVDRDEASNASAPAKKRRRLSAKEDEGEDDKLQEFLQVMQPPSKSKTWDNSDLLIGAPKPIPALEGDVETIPATDGKSDSEYEPLPKRQMKPKTEQSIQVDDASLQHVVATTNNPEDAKALATFQVEERALQPGPDATPVTTDDDWLRSRKSRLLGLVEDHETLAMRAPQRVWEEQEDAGDSEDRNMGGMRPADDTASPEAPAKSEPVSAETEEPAAGNGRLFLRNLAYTTTDDEIRKHFESHGFNQIEEVSKTMHPPTSIIASLVMNIQIGTTHAMQMMSTGRKILVDASFF